MRHSNFLSLSLSHSLSLSLSHSLTLTLSHTLTHSLTHSLTHRLSLSLSLSLSVVTVQRFEADYSSYHNKIIGGNRQAAVVGMEDTSWFVRQPKADVAKPLQYQHRPTPKTHMDTKSY